MKASDYLAAAAALPRTDLAGLLGPGGLVVVAPHPDDESLGCGGLIAAACDAERDVRLVVVSDGTGSHPNSRRFPHERLRDLREAETTEAAAALGLPRDHITFLRLPDRAVPVDGPAAQVAADAIATAATACAAGAVCVTWIADPHCDHEAAATLVLAARPHLPAAATVFFYPVWGWSLPPDTLVDGGPPRGARLDVSAWLDAKQRAIAAHRSQLTDLIDDDPDGFRLGADVLARFAGPDEIFICAEPLSAYQGEP